MFETNPSCTACPLYHGAISVCVPTICWHKGGDDALYVLGQNPGAEEDVAGVPFIGRAGKLLKAVYLEPLLKSGLNPTIYLANPARCGPVSPVPDRCLRICWASYGAPELAELAGIHRRIVVLATGAPATFSITGFKLESPWSLAKAFSNQAFEYAPNITVFWTYHPAYLLRKKVMAHAVADHLELVRQHFLSEGPSISQPHIVRPRPPCLTPPTTIQIDMTA
jgi:DNA polymerase